MPTIDLKPSHKAVKDYYAGLEEFHRLGVTHEMAVRAAFQRLLEQCCKKAKWTFVGEYKYIRKGQRPLRVDGAAVDVFNLPQAYWEAKDTQDDLPKEVEAKFEKGYPKSNILFQSPDRAILWQDSRQVLDEDITKPEILVQAVKELFGYQPESQRDWEAAVEAFKPQIPKAAATVVGLIETERKENKSFVQAFNTFAELCRSSINPNLADAAVEEMLVQHLMTERIFRRVFHNSEFTDRNIIAHEIERVIHALTSRKFSREEFLKPLDRFYGALEKRAETLDDYSQQQTFLNTVYEKFFQGFAVKVADTHGIVYTPQPIVDFMVRSVEEILKKEFGKSLSDEGVHILDPFVGTGNFITRIMREIKKTSLQHKYEHELHCNEVMLLPYYIASMSIEHEYYESTGEYKPFEGICLVDTFELAEDKQYELPLFTQENTERVEQLRKTKLFVIIGNPPYNAHQVDENDNNKNRKYRVMDKRVADTYSKDGTATLRNALSDPYVKAIRWASDKVVENGEGIVAFVSNNSFVDSIVFDGMRKHLENDFNCIYVLDLGGNVRKNPKISGTTHNVFGIQVGVSINIFIRLNNCPEGARIFYFSVDDFWRKEDRFQLLEASETLSGINWHEMRPQDNHTWLTDGLQEDFHSMYTLGDKSSSCASLFQVYSRGVVSNNDAYVFNSQEETVGLLAGKMVDRYNAVLDQIRRKGKLDNIKQLDRISNSDLKFIRNTKRNLLRGKEASFDKASLRMALYRPFFKQTYYFERIFNEDLYQMPRIFPTLASHSENLVVCLTGVGSRKPFHCLMTNLIPDFHSVSDTQCFPFYTYDEDGSTRRENITDWSLQLFSSHLTTTVNKWQIFYYVYGLLHSTEYREKYQANLKRELPRVPLPNTMEQFQAFVTAGERLADLHVNYESQPEYPLEKIENPNKQLNWRVEKMKLTKDKTAIVYNDFLTLAGIPPEAFKYVVRNKSALSWIIDRYQVRTDKRSGIVNDPNRPDDPQYIVRLIGQVITVSLETVKIVKGLPAL